MSSYEIVTSELNDDTFIKRIDADGKEWFIPKDEGNSDYQRYLRWLENPNAEEGGTL